MRLTFVDVICAAFYLVLSPGLAAFPCQSSVIYCARDSLFGVRHVFLYQAGKEQIVCHWVIIFMNSGVTIHAVMRRSRSIVFTCGPAVVCFAAPEFFPFVAWHCVSLASHCHDFWGCISIRTVPFTIRVCEDLLCCVLHRYLSAQFSIS
jgi:hypothetical protein